MRIFARDGVEEGRHLAQVVNSLRRRLGRDQLPVARRQLMMLVSKAITVHRPETQQSQKARLASGVSLE